LEDSAYEKKELPVFPKQACILTVTWTTTTTVILCRINLEIQTLISFTSKRNFL